MVKKIQFQKQKFKRAIERMSIAARVDVLFIEPHQNSSEKNNG